MRMIHTIAVIFLVSIHTLAAELTVYNCTGKPLDIQFFYGKKPADTVKHIPAIPKKSENFVPCKLVLPSFKLFKRRSFIIREEGQDNILTFGPYWSWCSDKTFYIDENEGRLIAYASE